MFHQEASVETIIMTSKLSWMLYLFIYKIDERHNVHVFQCNVYLGLELI